MKLKHLPSLTVVLNNTCIFIFEKRNYFDFFLAALQSA